MPLDEVVPKLREAVQIAADEGPDAVHRDAPQQRSRKVSIRALALLERMPEATFTGDFSHFVVIGEFYGWADEGAIDRMDPVLRRTAHLHGRISNGEQVQVDVGDGYGETAQFFVRLWARAMSHWRVGAGPGDVLPLRQRARPAALRHHDARRQGVSVTAGSRAW